MAVFFLPSLRNVVLWLKRTSTKKLANRISYQIWYKGCLKGKFCRGSKSAEGGPYPLADLDRGSKSLGGPNPLWHRVSRGHKTLWWLEILTKQIQNRSQRFRMHFNFAFSPWRKLFYNCANGVSSSDDSFSSKLQSQ